MRNNNPTLIILAGGKSSRMKTPKGLLPYKNGYWILSQIDAFKAGEMVCIGLGFDKELYFNAIPWLKNAIKEAQIYHGKIVRVIINPTPQFGLLSTLQAVLRKADKAVILDTVLVLPIDVPLLKASDVEKIILEKNEVVIPTYQQKNGHPVKLALSFWKSLLELDPQNQNARLDVQIKKQASNAVSIINVDDNNCIQNLNTQENWKSFISKL
ncbi:MAG: NTP transferase domain-containing protein [Polaribacter sp.]|nr:NTP transferase domain-containing protein [Polaribacter sp.]